MIDGLKPYPKMKDSGVEWLGKVPEHWDVERIKFLFREKDQRSGDGHGTLLSLTRARGIVPQADASKRMASASDLSKYKVCAVGDLVMNRMQAWSGMFAVSPQAGLVSPDYSVFALISEMQVKYFEQLFKTPILVSQFAQLSKGIGSGFNRLYSDDFGAIPAVVPPPAEQAAIVRFLDHADRRIRRYIRAKQKLIKLLEEQKQAVIHQAVTGQIDVRTGKPYPTYKPSGVEWLGDVPEHWDVKKLKYLVNVQGGMTPSKENNEYWHGSVPWVSPKDMKRPEIGDSIDHISELALAETGVQLIEPPAMLIVVRGMILIRTIPVGVTTVPVTINQDMKALLPRPGLDAVFLRHLFSGQQQSVRMVIEKAGHGTRILRTELLLGWSFAIPPLDEQVRINEEIVHRMARTTVAIDTARREMDLLHEYRTRLIADVVTGKLDVREAAAKLPSDPIDPISPQPLEDSLDDPAADEPNEAEQAEELVSDF